LQVLSDSLLRIISGADDQGRAAQDCGYSKFVVYSLTSNPAVRPLLARVADVMSSRTHYGMSETTFVSRRLIESIRREPADGELSGWEDVRGRLQRALGHADG
jgi:hypothetical protein